MQSLYTKPSNILAILILVAIIIIGVVTGHLPPGGFAKADSDTLVSMFIDGQKRVIITRANTVGDALQQENITLSEGDIVEPLASSPITNGQFNINVYRARPVVVIDGYRSYHLATAFQSPRLIAQQAGLEVYPEDSYTMTSSSMQDMVGIGSVGDKVVIERAIPVNISVDGRTREIRTRAESLGSALNEAGIALGAKDTVSEPLAAAVQAPITVSISRVTDALVTVTDPIARTTKTTNDPTVNKGTTSVKVEGSDGSKTATYRVHYQDGRETSRELAAVVSTTDPVAREIVTGTKVTFAGSVEYWRPMVVEAAAEWDFDPNIMMRIMACESKGDASVVSRFVVNGQNPTGLFQYLPSTWRAAGGTDDNILDGATQIKITAKKMALYGTGPWQCK